MIHSRIEFPPYSGLRCLMMPYIQGCADSLPVEYSGYAKIIDNTYIAKHEVGYLTIDESPVVSGVPHRGARARHGRALHTEAGLRPQAKYAWGGWGSSDCVLLEPSVEVLLASDTDDSCALWDGTHAETSRDGDIGYAAKHYPYGDATISRRGEVYRIGILQPHESLPIKTTGRRAFLRIVSSGVHGREPYFTPNPVMNS